ncbi:MAG: SMP-30/gluconolactonase/LRE family protein [Chloroflexota bacterium]
MMLPELYINARATLGESPAWDAKTQTLYWVDVLERHIYAGGKRILQLDDYVGCLAPRREGGLVIAQRRGFRLVVPDMKTIRKLPSPRGESLHNRFNDGKCDPRGRFVVGTMDHNEKEDSGALYSVSPEGQAKKLLTRVRISNGLAWSPDGKTMYFIDTPSRQVMAFDYDLDTGGIMNARVIIQFDKSFGWPDGMTSDADGNLWIALWGGARVSQWKPDGTLLAQFGVEALNVTSCVFGGPGMNELFITTALAKTDAASFRRFPHAGGVFRMDTHVTGMPTYEFGG